MRPRLMASVTVHTKLELWARICLDVRSPEDVAGELAVAEAR